MTDHEGGLRPTYDRATRILRRALDGPPLPADELRPVLHEMTTIIEELRVADEELTVQAEQLAASSAAIDEERARFAELFDAAPDAYVETDEHGKILEANRAAETLLGVPRRLLYGRLLITFVDEADRRPVRRAIASPARSAGDRAGGAGGRRGGSPTDVGLTVAASRPDDQGRSRLRWILRDVSERLRLEARVAEMAEQVDLATALVEVTRLTAGPDPLLVMLPGVTRLAASVLASGEVGVTLVERADLEAQVASGPLAVELDARQREKQDGPCFLAVESGAVVHAPPADWPAFAEVAVDGRVVDVLSIPLVRPGGEVVGALNTYAQHELTEREVELLCQVAAQAVVALGNAELFESSTRLADELAQALESRGVIEQAKGLIMAREGCDPDAAIDILKRASQRENVKLREIARRMVDQASRADRVTGSVLGPVAGRPGPFLLRRLAGLRRGLPPLRLPRPT